MGQTVTPVTATGLFAIHRQVTMTWALHQDSALPGPVNMAKDEMCLEWALESGRPIVRLYEWDRLTLSLGRAQKLDRQIDLQACEALDIPLVRRSTGGRAVLHGRDLTYSVCAPFAGSHFRGGIMEVYQDLSRVFLALFQELGLHPQVKSYAGRERAMMASANCFATPSAFEILVGGKKLVGSAQQLRKGGFLQHGSIPLYPQHKELSRIYRGLSASEAGQQMTDLETLGVWREHTLEEVRSRLVAAFERTMDITFESAPWSEEDELRLRTLCESYPLMRAGQAANLAQPA